MKKLIYLFFICSTYFATAQSSLITGKVIIDNPIEGYGSIDKINIVNSNSNAKTVTNEQGLFSIRVEENDVLIFSSDWYLTRELKVVKSVIEKGYLEIHLEPEVIELAEAKLHNLSKNLKDNLSIIENPLDQTYRNMGIDPQLRFRKININHTSSLGGGMLTAISRVTGQYKRDKRQYDYFKKVDKIDGIISFYTKDYFVNSLRIPENKVYEFVNWVYDEKKMEALLKKSAYQEMNAILESYSIIYLANLKIDKSLID